MKELRRDLEGLDEVLRQGSMSVNSGWRITGQVKLAIKGFDKTIKQYVDRIEDTKNTLKLILGNQVGALVEGNHTQS